MITKLSYSAVENYLILYAIGHMFYWCFGKGISYLRKQVTLEYKHLIKHHVQSSHSASFKHCTEGDCAIP